VLLVDDHADTCEIVSRLLGMDGYIVTCAGTLAEAYTAIKSGTFELLICDVALPDGEGLRLFAYARQWYPAQGITLSGFDPPDAMARAKAAGFYAHLAKPFSLRELREAMKDALSNNSVEQPVGAPALAATAPPQPPPR
jgi:CheY-like chemotaxis protein